MIDCRNNRFSLELLHNYKVDTITENFVFSSIYQKIVNISRNAPLYLIYPSDELQSFATQLKQVSLTLGDMLNHYFSNDSSNPLKKLQLTAPPSQYIEVKTLESPEEPVIYDILVEAVATGQLNQGKSVSKNTCPFTAQTFSFRIETDENSFDFEIPVKNDSSNEIILTRILNIIKQTANHLDASIENEDSKISLLIQAQANRRNKPAHFTIRDITPNGLVSYYGLDRIMAQPQSSVFFVNDKPFRSFGIAFEIDNLFELTLKAPCSEHIQVAFEINNSLIIDEIHQLAEMINQLLILSSSCSNIALKCELTSFLTSYQSELSSIGIVLNESIMLETNTNQLIQSIADSSLENILSKNEPFTQELMKHTQEISLNPMKYVPNKVVSYKDYTTINYPNPYLTSMYSGFLFTNLC